MKFLIQKIEGEIKHDFSFTLLEAIRYHNWRGNEIKYKFTDGNLLTLRYSYDDFVPIGSNDFVHMFLREVHDLYPKPINVPNDLMDSIYTQRSVANMELSSERSIGSQLFIKSNDDVKGFCSLVKEGDVVPDGYYQVSTPIRIESEWRAFVYQRKFVGLQNYSGDFTIFPNVKTIELMIHKYHEQPIAYTLDVGVNEFGTFVIEVHNFYSCGLYGFADLNKLPHMFSRWFDEYIKSSK